MRLARAAALTHGRPNPHRCVSHPATVLDNIERFVRHGGKSQWPPISLEEEADAKRRREDEERLSAEEDMMTTHNSSLDLQTSFVLPAAVVAALAASSSSQPGGGGGAEDKKQQRSRGESYISARSTTTQDTSDGASSAANSPGSLAHTVNHLSPSVASAVEETVVLATSDPICCQLCAASKAETPVCRATGMFHPEYLSARALERQFGGDDAASSVIHFMPPQTVIPRADISETLKRFAAACKKSPELPGAAQERKALSDMCDAVIERYRTECLDLLEEADILLFQAALDDDSGPLKITSKANRRDSSNNIVDLPDDDTGLGDEVAKAAARSNSGGGGGGFDSAFAAATGGTFRGQMRGKSSSIIVNDLLKNLPKDA